MAQSNHVSPFCDAPVVDTIFVDGRTIRVRAQGGDYEACIRSYAASLQPSERKVKQPLPEMSTLNALA